MSYEELQLSMFILGPRLIGSCIDIFLQGVLCSQFAAYFTAGFDDRLPLRLSVIGLLIMTTLKAIHSFATIWIIFILHFKDLRGAILLNYTKWWQTGSALMVATIGIYVQTFFCWRLWSISKRRYYTLVPVVLVLLFAYMSICIATYYISRGEGASSHIGTWFAAHLSSVFAGDLMITLSTVYFLLKMKEDALPQTAGIVAALIRLTFQSAAPAALCAMFNLIFSQLYAGDQKLISTAFNQTLSKLYAFSMMWTLNARRVIRENANRSLHLSTLDRMKHRRRGTFDLIGQSEDMSTDVSIGNSVRRVIHPYGSEMKSSAISI